MPTIEAQVVVVGGGIAGLWTLRELLGAGVDAVLVSRGPLGGGQTIGSQGIVHGGIKYALGGKAQRASQSLAETVGSWRAALAGRGIVDLRAARVLTDHQYLWTTGGLGARVFGFAASRVLRSGVTVVRAPERPDVFNGAPPGIDVYRVEEVVLDPESLVRALAADVGVRIVQGDQVRACGDGGVVERVTARSDGVEERTLVGAHYVLAAGSGNAALLGSIGSVMGPGAGGEGLMQRRPLHMVMARGAALRPIWGHCLGAGTLPRATITTQPDRGGRVVWYIGGGPAESGVLLDRAEQIEAARREVASCLPWVSLAGVEWATLRIDRAEGRMPDGSRPDEPVVLRPAEASNVVAAWPTKLAFAPLCARRVIRALGFEGRSSVRPAPAPIGGGDAPAEPTVARLPWNEEGLEWS
ncbi:MAG: FAD-dependent oxidoreductase [Phycisphaerae bacterium]|nr:FAD-dependent oxidoreductase [Phycisphaerae bacterium]